MSAIEKNMISYPSHSKRMGFIVASPNPIPLTSTSGLVSTTIQWISTGTDSVEVRIGGPDGNLFCRSGGTGSAETGNWVQNGMTFFLQDVSGERHLSLENTLSTVTIRVEVEPLAIMPDIVEFAAWMGHRLGRTRILSIGASLAHQLDKLNPQFKITVFDLKSNPDISQKELGFGRWIEWDMNQPDKIPVSAEVLDESIIICADIFKNMTNPDPFLGVLKHIMDRAPLCILTMPGENLSSQILNTMAPGNDGLSPSMMEEILRSKGFNIAFTGSTAGTILDFEKKTFVAILEKNGNTDVIQYKAPVDFRVVAIMAAYNEADIIIPSMQYLIDQGIDVYLIDNWSTDATFSLAEELLGKGLIGIEKFPGDRDSTLYEWEALLRRKEELTREIRADWFIHYDVDEIRESPWPAIKLKDAIYMVDRAGFNCIDHTVVEFKPTDDHFMPGSDFRSHFKYFQFGKRLGDFTQIKAWKNSGQIISLAESGGHEVRFDGRRIYPYKFLLRHYQIRSQSQGYKKIFTDRIPRWNPAERAKGWHTHYDTIQENHNFICSPLELESFDETVFYKKYLTERLSGIGIARADFVSRIDSIDIPYQELKNQVAKLGNRNILLELKIAELESYYLSLSRKWWIRCIVFLSRLLGKKHSLDRPFESNSSK